MKVLIVVTHLLGSGHLSRALTLARAVQRAGHEAHVISGGVRPPALDPGDVRFHQLPPVQSDGVDFSRLLDAQGLILDPAYLAARQSALIDLFHQVAPDVLITELFPFGRRILRAEFLALLEAARGAAHPPLVLSSVRDILAPPSKPAKAAFADDLVARFYDGVLVHSAPQITPLSLSWPVSDSLAPRLQYTGFVAPPPAPPHPEAAGEGEVLVSAGGGAVGKPLFDCACAAAALDPGRRWRLLIGGRDGAVRAQAINAVAPQNLIAETARPDFRQMLHHAAASVSLCGYNTALDLLQTRCPAVFVPFDDGAEVEQGLRAQALAEAPGIETLATADLTPERLISTIAAAQNAPRVPLPPEQTRGAEDTVRILEEMLEARNGD